MYKKGQHAMVDAVLSEIDSRPQLRGAVDAAQFHYERQIDNITLNGERRIIDVFVIQGDNAPHHWLIDVIGTVKSAAVEFTVLLDCFLNDDAETRVYKTASYVTTSLSDSSEDALNHAVYDVIANVLERSPVFSNQ